MPRLGAGEPAQNKMLDSWRSGDGDASPTPGIDGPILVYQMGKVGSMALFRALKALKLPVPIYHCHNLNHLDEWLAQAGKLLPDPSGTIKVIRHDMEVRNALLAARHRRSNVISVVRDPVARSVSHFFYAITERITDFYARLHAGTLDSRWLTEMFLQDPQVHATTLSWFDAQLRDCEYFGIDVFATPFGHDEGYQIVEGASARLLVLRLEDFPESPRRALRGFLNIGDFELDGENAGRERSSARLHRWFMRRVRPRDFQLRTENTGEDQPYAEAYRWFKREAVLPASYLDRMYGSKLATHFYRPEEIQRFRAAWAKEHSD